MIASTMLCSSCNAPIVWAVMPHGTRILLDVAPSPRGNIRLEQDAGAAAGGVAVLYATFQLGPAPAGVVLYRCHFATCTKYGGDR